MAKYYKKKSYRKKSPSWYNKKYSTMQLAAKAWRGVKYIKGLVNSEMYHTIQNGSGLLSNAASPTVLNITAIAQGDTNTTRTGNSILLRNIAIRMEFINNTLTTATLYRIMLVQDNQTVADETTLAVTDILESASTLSFISTTTTGRFKILKNWYFSTDSVSKVSKTISSYNSMMHHVRYNGTASTDVQKGAIFLVAFSDDGTNKPLFSYNIKTSYHDN